MIIKLRNLRTCLQWLPVVIASFLLTACEGDSDLEELTRPFTLALNADANALTLVEGDTEGLVVPFQLRRGSGHTAVVAVSVAGVNNQDTRLVTLDLSRESLDASASETQLTLKLAIDDKPIQPGSRQFVATARDGDTTQRLFFTIATSPVNAPDVYLLIGQSNMVGFGGDGDKDAGPGGEDEPNDRIQQLNVTKNDDSEVFTSVASYTLESRIAVPPLLVRAEDPLHRPLDPDTLAKEEDFIGPGLSFAKAALGDTTRNIVLVPAAWSGSSFCRRTLTANWNAQNSTETDLGNTLLFDRAVARTNLALRESGGILRGILWHQGETDADGEFPRCAELYADNLRLLITELRTSIQQDARGALARTADANIPFVLGTMSMGIDDRGDLSDFEAEKRIVDGVHRSIETLVSHGGLTVLDDLTPANGFPCGNTSCIHFGSAAYRVMGQRYYETLKRLIGD